MTRIPTLLFATALRPAAALANQITYHVGGLAAVTVLDGAAEDLDPAANRVRVDFDQTVDLVAFSWRATGTLIGHADPAFGDHATTRLLNLTIQNLRGNIAGQMLTFSHAFAQLGPPLPINTLDLSGHFDSLVTPGYLEGGRLEWSATVDWLGGTESLGAGDTGHVMGVAPIPFAFAGTPAAPIHPIAHNGAMIFYLDSPGDAIFMGAGEGWNIQAAPVPEPRGVVALMGLLWAVRRRR